MGDNNAAAAAGRRTAASSSAPALGPPLFLVTSFGPFCGVQHNPTQSLVQWLKTQTPHGAPAAHAAAAKATTGSGSGPAAGVQPGAGDAHQPSGDGAAAAAAAAPPPPLYSIKSLSVLEVSAAAVDAYMAEQAQQLLAEAQAAEAAGGKPRPVVLLHLGVDTQRPALSLELQAYNNATFSCPDERGWQPKGHLIEAAPGLGCSSVRTTTLPLQELVQQLRAAGFECGVSRDAGRFVCNYTYHRSLEVTSRLQQQLAVHSALRTVAAHPQQQQQQQQAGSAPGAWPCFSLFVHVPSFDVVDEHRQRAFLLHLLELVAKVVAGGGGGHQQQPVGQQQQQQPVVGQLAVAAE